MWDVYLSQSLDGGRTFTESMVTDHPNYFGNYCTTGIFCGIAPPQFNWGNTRILYENFGVAIGPDGGARVVWTDTRDSWSADCAPGPTTDNGCQVSHAYFACQTSGTGLHGETVTGCGKSTPPRWRSPGHTQLRGPRVLPGHWRLNPVARGLSLALASFLFVWRGVRRLMR